MAPKVTAVMKKTRAMLSCVKAMNIVASESPIRAAKIQNTIWAEDGDILWRRKENRKTRPRGASMTTHWRGEPNRRTPSWVNPTRSPCALVTTDSWAVPKAMMPVMASATPM